MPPRLAKGAEVVEHPAVVAVGSVHLLVTLRVPQTVIVNRRAVAALNGSACPRHSAIVRHHGAVHVVISLAASYDEGAVGGDGDDRAVPYAGQPIQTAVDDIRPGHIAVIGLPGVGAGHGAIDGEIGDFQNGQTGLVCGDVTAGKVAAALNCQLQPIGPVLHIYYTRELVEYHAGLEKSGSGKLAGPARFAERAVVVEDHAALP